MLFCLPFVRESMCCTLFLNFWVAYIAALLKAGADYGLAHELSKAHNIFRYYNLSGTNSHAVCVLALKFGKTGDSHYKQKR